MFSHGGELEAASALYGIPVSDWLDVSTGINPRGWPIPPIAEIHWRQLPQDAARVYDAARGYYCCHQCLPVAGSQMAIRWLPRLRSPCKVAVQKLSYSEHALSWEAAGHQVNYLTNQQLDLAAEQADVLVVVNPNNPDGCRWSNETLLQWADKLAARGGWLIVDEAFMDATPEHSLAAYCDRSGLFVLRSLGKFFGLAGARVGFVLAHRSDCDNLRSAIGPWRLSGPAEFITVKAFTDTSWQQQTVDYLTEQSHRLRQLMTLNGLSPHGGTVLFQWVKHPNAQYIHRKLAEQGLLTRLFLQPASLRFGLPGDGQWQRFESTLAETMHSVKGTVR